MPNSARTIRRLRLLSWLFVIMLLLNAIVGVQLVLTRSAVNHTAQAVASYQRCQAAYQQAFIAAYKPRTDANADTQKALDQVISVVTQRLRGQGEAGSIEKALENYRKVRRDQRNEQAKHPVPPLPTTVCGPAPKE